jgi:hypothetical protein
MGINGIGGSSPRPRSFTDPVAAKTVEQKPVAKVAPAKQAPATAQAAAPQKNFLEEVIDFFRSLFGGKPAPALNSYQTELRDVAQATFPTVLTDDQAKLLKNPTVTGTGRDAGAVTMTYDLKDGATAASLAKALNDGWDGIYENTNEGLNTVGMTNMKITAQGNKLTVTMDYKVGG